MHIRTVQTTLESHGQMQPLWSVWLISSSRMMYTQTGERKATHSDVSLCFLAYQ